ncbi:MAG: hypothetical protein J3Q66DRAFT_359582 [Benniella sp.]|nr:MAG: hypothetical protein J3Q66DRAFT_359582 [Benniella sp.]
MERECVCGGRGWQRRAIHASSVSNAGWRLLLVLLLLWGRFTWSFLFSVSDNHPTVYWASYLHRVAACRCQGKLMAVAHLANWHTELLS